MKTPRRSIAVGLLSLVLGITGLTGPGLNAYAQDNCDLHGRLIESLSLSQTLTAQANNPDVAMRLDRVASSLQLSDLVMGGIEKVPERERDALFAYVISVRDAATQARNGQTDTARAVLSQRVTPELFAGLSTLETQWSCRLQDSDDVDYGVDIAQGRKGTGNQSDKTASSPGQAGNPANASQPRTNQTAASKTADGGAYFGRNAIVGGNTMLFYLMLLGFALIGLIYYLQQRMRRSNVRERRRILDQPVRVFIKGTPHQLRLIDMSMNGAKLGHSGEIQDETDVGLEVAGEWQSGQVRWFNANFAGVRFKRPLDPELVERAAGLRNNVIAAE